MKSNKYVRLFSFLTFVIIGSLLLVGCAPTIEELINKRDESGLIKALKNKDEEVRASAATALGDFENSHKTVTPLIKALEDKSENVRLKAEAALVKTEAYAITQLLTIMKSGTSVSPVAKRILEKIVVNLVDELINGYYYTTSSKYAKESLLRIGDLAVDPLIKVIGEDKVGAINVVEVLGDIGDARAIVPLIIVLNDSDTLMVEIAAGALKKMSDQSFQPLLNALEKKGGAAYALIRIGRSGTEPVLIEALNEYGDKEMAEYYLNSGNALLKKAAIQWAYQNHYVLKFNVTSTGDGPYWGN